MTNPEEQSTSPLGETIIKTIETKELTMRPKWHFVLHISLLIIGTILASLTLLFIVSFTVFTLRQDGSWFAPSFGFAGWQALLISLPWILIILALVFSALVVLLARSYSFAYGRPLLYSALGIVVIAGVGGFLIALTPLHSGLSDLADDDQLPVAGTIYRQFNHRPVQNVVMGKIIKQLPQGFGLESPDEEIFIVYITPQTQLPPQPLAAEDIVIVLGERRDNIITAMGIRPVGPHAGVRVSPRHRR